MSIVIGWHRPINTATLHNTDPVVVKSAKVLPGNLDRGRLRQRNSCSFLVAKGGVRWQRS